MFTATFATVVIHADWRLPGAPFLLAAVLVFVSMLLVWRTTQPLGAAATESA
jgi:hypothetical protein